MELIQGLLLHIYSDRLLLGLDNFIELCIEPQLGASWSKESPKFVFVRLLWIRVARSKNVKCLIVTTLKTCHSILVVQKAVLLRTQIGTLLLFLKWICIGALLFPLIFFYHFKACIDEKQVCSVATCDIICKACSLIACVVNATSSFVFIRNEFSKVVWLDKIRVVNEGLSTGDLLVQLNLIFFNKLGLCLSYLACTQLFK